MLIGLFADIHANRQAFSSCLAQARDLGAEPFIFLGDYVGYGAEPDWTVSTVIDLVAEGAIAVLGNHDSAVSNTRVQLNAEAQAVIEWTRGEPGVAQRRFLASRPQSWKYIVDATDAARSINATSAHVTFCGHIHKPALYSLSAAGKMTAFTPTSGVSVQLLPGRQWLAVLGSVGQPRDGNPAASYAMLDTTKCEITYCRAPYDVDEAADRIRNKGLPTWLAERLFVGK